MTMRDDAAETGRLQELLSALGTGLDRFLTFEHPDALHPSMRWRESLDAPLPKQGVGIERIVDELLRHVIPGGSAVPRPGFSSFITTGGTTASTLASTAASIASPQRYGHTAFNFLEDLSLRWLAELFGLKGMQGVYSSGGSVANLLALGAARQRAFERLGHDPAADGVHGAVAIYATQEAHHTIRRAAGVLGLGRRAVHAIACDRRGRMDATALRTSLEEGRRAGVLPLAVVASAGTTNTGAIDPLQAVGELAREFGAWFHVDGAYGLPGILDERVALQYRGLDAADSVIVDPHKWLGAAVGVAATFVRDRGLLKRAFTQEPATYLEGSMESGGAEAQRIEHSMDDFGIPYYDFGVELSAPSRGVVVWSLIREIGVDGIAERIRRHNDMAAYVSKEARSHPNLELLLEPTLSICCFRYVAPDIDDLDGLNQQLHRRLMRANRNMPSTTRVNGRLALRPCFVGARSEMGHARELVADVLRIGAELVRERAQSGAMPSEVAGREAAMDPLGRSAGKSTLERRPLVVALHASASSSRQWRELGRALEPDMQLLAVDLIGHGDAAEQRATEFRQLLLEDAFRVMPHVRAAAAAGRAVHIVGHSYGGAVALKLASMAELGCLRSLVVYEPVMFGLLAEDADSAPHWRRVIELVDTLQGCLDADNQADAGRRFITFWSGAQGWHRLSKTARVAAIDAMPVVMQQFDATMSEQESAKAVEHLALPVLVLSGAHTVPVAKRISERLRALWPRAIHRVLPDAGHMGPLSHAAAVNRHITTFLSAVGSDGFDPPRVAAGGRPCRQRSPGLTAGGGQAPRRAMAER
jgi:aromatic-L-amino-acid/L-tryptophan decarboxylase